MEHFGMSWQAYVDTPEFVVERMVVRLNERAQQRAMDEISNPRAVRQMR